CARAEAPAKEMSPPSRTIATAWFAAQPPPVIMNSLAATLVPGAGKCSTCITMSCTAMPAQRIFGAALAKTDLVLYPGADDVMRDRDRGRRGQAVGVLAH